MYNSVKLVSDSESDNDSVCQSKPSFITNGPIVTSNQRKSAQRLLDNITTLKDVTNIEQLTTLLQQILDYKSDIKYFDPYLHCWYVYDGRAGIFKASGGWHLSEFITAKVCKATFSYSDVLGKHSEVNFTIDEVNYEYVDEMLSDGKDYQLIPEDHHSSCSQAVYETVLAKLQEYMYSLDALSLCDYKEMRHSELHKYAESCLSSLLKTNNPSIEISRPNQHSPYENIIIPLSLYLVYRVKESHTILFPRAGHYSFLGSKDDITWQECHIKPNPYNTVRFDQKKFNKYREIEQEIKVLLQQYQATDPVEFFETYFTDLLSICQQRYSSH